MIGAAASHVRDATATRAAVTVRLPGPSHVLSIFVFAIRSEILSTFVPSPLHETPAMRPEMPLAEPNVPVPSRSGQADAQG